MFIRSPNYARLVEVISLTCDGVLCVRKPLHYFCCKLCTEIKVLDCNVFFVMRITVDSRYYDTAGLKEIINIAMAACQIVVSA